MSKTALHDDLNVINYAIEAKDVRDVLSKYILADGYEFVLDIENSHGCTLVNAVTGEEYLDFFSFYASSALGMNHPKMMTPEFREKIAWAGINKPANSDIYTQQMAEFVEYFGKYVMPSHFKYLFFVEGGSVAVENALKVAMDWKVRKNFAKGIKEEKGFQIIHFKEAFHGRTGYTLSLTNTDPNKVNYFPKFPWPRISNPKIIHPLQENLNKIIEAEKRAIEEIHDAIKNNPDDIAAIIIEPIQAEGGDNHFRPEFLSSLRDICDKNEIMLIFDEVQTGFGMTGKWWCSEYFVMPDIIAFGKKVQVCGIMVSERVDEIKDNCFHVSSRINSTWGGNFTDMVRSAKIIEIMAEENVVENSAVIGEYLLAELHKLNNDFPSIVSSPRGKGLMCAFDMPDKILRNQFIDKCFEEKLFILGCGPSAVRFRTPLIVTKEEIDRGLNIIRKVLKLMS